MTERKIITDYNPPPIPTDKFNYTAYREGDDNDEDFLMGYGATKAEAIADLLDQEACAQDEAEARARKAVKL